MIQTLKKHTSLVIAAIVLLFALSVTSTTVRAQDIQGSLNCGGDEISLDTGCAKPGPTEGSNKIENLIKTIINIFSAIVGSISVIMIIVGGFRYITSAGDSNNVSGAKNTILYAIVGLIIVAFAQIIVQFVLQRGTPA